MAIGRITGQMLSTNLERQGVDISIDGNLLYADVTQRRIGINNTSPTQSLDASGNVKLANLSILGNTIVSNTGKINLGTTSNIVITGGTGYDVLYTDGAGNLAFGNINLISQFDTLSGEFVYGNVRTANVAFFTNATLATSNFNYYPPFFNTTAGNSAAYVDPNFYYNPSTGVLTVTAIGTANVDIGNVTTDLANVGTLTVTQGFFTANAVIQGGYVNNLANISAALGYITQLNATNANVSGTLYAGNFNSANVSFTGVTTGTVSTANVTMYTNLKVVSSGVTGDYYLPYYDQSNGNAAARTNINLRFDDSTGNLFVDRLWSNTNITTSNVAVDWIAPRLREAVYFSGNSAIVLPNGTIAERPTQDIPGYFRFNTELQVPEYYDGNFWVPITDEPPAISSQTFYGDNVTTDFELLIINQTSQGLLVSINGTVQTPSDGYIVGGLAGNVITFAEAPLTSDQVDIRFLSVGVTPTIGNVVGNVDILGNLSVTDNSYFYSNIFVTNNTTTGNATVVNTLTAANLQITSFGNVVSSWIVDSVWPITGNWNDIFVRPDGLKLYVAAAGQINEYDLIAPFDISTSAPANVAAYNMSGVDTATLGLWFDSTGTKMYTSGQTSVANVSLGTGTSEDRAYEFNLSTPWTVNTATVASSIRFSAAEPSGAETGPAAIYLDSSLTTFYMAGSTLNAIHQYTLSTPGNLATAAYVGNISINAYDTSVTGITFNTDQSRLYLTGSGSDNITEFALSTPGNVLTATLLDNTFVGFQDLTPAGIYYNDSANVAFMVGTTSDSVYKYLTNVGGVALSTPTVQAKIMVVGDVRIKQNLAIDGEIYADGDANFGGITTGAISATTVSGTSITGSTTLSITGNADIASATTASLIRVGYGATTSGTTKAIQIGTSGASGSFTNITIGSETVGALGFTRIAGGNVVVSPTTTSTSSTTGALVVAGGIGSAGNIVTAANVSDAIGNLRDLPINSTATPYTLAFSDAGKTVSISAGNIIIPNNVFRSGQTVTFFNNSATAANIVTLVSTTIYLAGTSLLGNRAFAQRGLATIVCVAANTFVISGAGLS
jgi:hypothetical protein